MSKGFKLFLRILLYCFSFLPIFFIIFNIVENHDETLVKTITFTLLALEIIITEIVVHKKNKVKIENNNNNDINNNETKICKYCMSNININAKVCPNCKRGLTFNTNVGVLAILLIIVGFLIWGIFSNNAPLFMRKTVCGLGIRNDFPYCYYIDFND